jgi:tetratricopeptide (TPR) repeat protein
MRFRRSWTLIATTLFLAGCASVARPPVLPPPPQTTPPSEVAAETSSYRTAADASRVLEAIDKKLAGRQATAADLSTPDLATYSNLLLAAGRLPEAEQALGILDGRRPGDKTVLLSLALLAGARGDATTQASRVMALEKAFPGDPDAGNLRARQLLVKGDLAGAKAAWLAVLDHREDVGALTGLAEMALDAKKPQDALPLADRAVKAAPQDDQAWALHARVQSDLGLYPAAKRDLDKALTLAPDDSWHHLDRGKLAWLHLYDPNLAQGDLEFTTIKDPENFFGWSALAEVYEEQLRPRQAYDAWMKALSLRPDYRFGYPSAAMLSFRYQDFPRAAAFAREAAKDYPAEYAFPFVEALSLKAMGKGPAAVAVLEKARPRFTRGSTVDEFFRFLLTTGSGADYYFNAAMNLEKQENILLRLRFYQGCYYALTKSPGAAKAAFDEVGASSLIKIPEIGASKDWLDHGL